MATLFVTGATGVLGGRFLYEMLKNSSDDLYCLVRAENKSHAFERLKEAVSLYDVQGELTSCLYDRLTPVLGDVAKDKLDLNPTVYDRIQQKATKVVHIAGAVSFASLYPQLKMVNVDGTARVIKFCLQADLPMLHISSYSVLGMKMFDKGLTYYEEDFDIGQSFGKVYYPKSKFEGEKLVQQARVKGLKAIVIRPGNIFGDSKTGIYPISTTTVPGLYYDILRTSIVTGLAMNEHVFDMSPSDYIAEGMRVLLNMEEAYGKNFHFTNPDRKKFDELASIITDFGFPIQTLPFEEFIQMFKNKKVLVDGKPYNSGFISLATTFDYLFSKDELEVTIDTSVTQSFLEKEGIYCPKIDKELIGNYLNYCITQKYIPELPNKVSLLNEY